MIIQRCVQECNPQKKSSRSKSKTIFLNWRKEDTAAVGSKAKSVSRVLSASLEFDPEEEKKGEEKGFMLLEFHADSKDYFLLKYVNTVEFGKIYSQYDSLRTLNGGSTRPNS